MFKRPQCDLMGDVSLVSHSIAVNCPAFDWYTFHAPPSRTSQPASSDVMWGGTKQFRDIVINKTAGALRERRFQATKNETAVPLNLLLPLEKD